MKCMVEGCTDEFIDNIDGITIMYMHVLFHHTSEVTNHGT